MFYCDKCMKERDWPMSFHKSYGKCEMCDEIALCNDVPSKYLPPPMKERDGMKYFTEADLPEDINPNK